MTDHAEHGREKDDADQRGRARKPQREPHDAHPSSAVSPLPLYADPAWIAANFRALVDQTVAALSRSGAESEEALDATHEAVARLYSRLRPELASTRDISRFLRLVAFRELRRERVRRTRVELRGALVDRAADDETEVVLEHRLRLQDLFEVLAGMRPNERAPLLEVLRQELVAMGGYLDDGGVESWQEAELGRPERGRNDAERMRLHRARSRLRRRTRHWLAGVPSTRLFWRRQLDVGPLSAALGATACVAAFVVLSLPNIGVPSGITPRGVATSASAVSESRLSPARNGPVSVLPPKHSQQVQSASPARSAAAAKDSSGASRPTPLLEGSPHAVSNHDRPPGDSTLVCIRHLRPLEDTCVPHPLLSDPPGVEPPRSGP